MIPDHSDMDDRPPGEWAQCGCRPSDRWTSGPCAVVTADTIALHSNPCILDPQTDWDYCRRVTVVHCCCLEMEMMVNSYVTCQL